MSWTTPTLVEVYISLEINGYLPAELLITLSVPEARCFDNGHPAIVLIATPGPRGICVCVVRGGPGAGVAGHFSAHLSLANLAALNIQRGQCCRFSDLLSMTP